MDNDILINQARQLYVFLHTKQITSSATILARLERLISYAYLRYQRRLNRCALCYQHRAYNCIRAPGEKHIPCKPRNQRQFTNSVDSPHNKAQSEQR
jgi:hypothetical protein